MTTFCGKQRARSSRHQMKVEIASTKETCAVCMCSLHMKMDTQTEAWMMAERCVNKNEYFGTFQFIFPPFFFPSRSKGWPVFRADLYSSLYGTFESSTCKQILEVNKH